MSFYPADLTSHRDIPTFEELTSPDVAAAAAAGAHVIVATGATEQHGRFLPLGTDTYQGLEMARRAAFTLCREGVPVLVGPTIPFGPKAFLSESPKDFPGTISLSHDTLKRLTEEICRELVGHGFRFIHLLCVHAESDPVNQIVAKEVSDTTDASVLTLSWLTGIQPGYRGIMRSARPQGHAGEGEVARMLAIAPHLVRMGECHAFHPSIPPNPAPNDKMPYIGGAIGRYKYPPGVFEGFEGVWGDPANGTAEVGETSYGLINDWVCAAIRAEWTMWQWAAKR